MFPSFVVVVAAAAASAGGFAKFGSTREHRAGKWSSTEDLILGSVLVFGQTDRQTETEINKEMEVCCL